MNWPGVMTWFSYAANLSRYLVIMAFGAAGANQ